MVSVIIPTLNEEQNLPETLAAVRASAAPLEIIVADGGSTDATCRVAERLGAEVCAGDRPQRAAQMNLGASRARGEVLLFLHADTRLPPGGLDLVVQALLDPAAGGGAFARRFDSPSLFLKISCALAEARNRAVGWHLGDQAMFVRRTLFDRLNGFADRDSFEDLDFSRRLARLARLVTLRPPVTSSARRFASGPLRRTLRDLTLTARYLLARSPR